MKILFNPEKKGSLYVHTHLHWEKRENAHLTKKECSCNIFSMLVGCRSLLINYKLI